MRTLQTRTQGVAQHIDENMVGYRYLTTRPVKAFDTVYGTRMGCERSFYYYVVLALILVMPSSSLLQEKCFLRPGIRCAAVFLWFCCVSCYKAHRMCPYILLVVPRHNENNTSPVGLDKCTSRGYYSL